MSATRKTTQKFKSFQIIHDEYQKALAESNDIMDIVSNFRKRIEKPPPSCALGSGRENFIL